MSSVILPDGKIRVSPIDNILLVRLFSLFNSPTVVLLFLAIEYRVSPDTIFM